MDSKHRRPCIMDCLSGEYLEVSQTPFFIGGGEGCDWRIVEDGLPDRLFAVELRRSGFCVVPARGVTLEWDGNEAEEENLLVPGQDHSVVCCGQLFGIRVTSQPSAWAACIDTNKWYIHDQEQNRSQGPFAWADIAVQLQKVQARYDKIVVVCSGLSMGFFPEQVLSASTLVGLAAHPQQQSLAAAGAFSGTSSTSAGTWTPPPPAWSSDTYMADEGTAEINAEHGEFTCPVCWLRFDRGDVMNIAVHASLRGDPILGEAAMQRFLATRFNDKGQALDAMNLPSTEQACPHCRRKLPPGFLDTPHYIFSIVGAPSSGKSYYLSVLIKLLQQTLFRDFHVIFRDADPSENVILTQMKTSLFSAGTPQDAYLAKTDLEGALYEALPRYGRRVRLPKPFIFRLSAAQAAQHEASIVFYDNAGEHFEPTRNSADSPGAQHIAVASGIFFLFDPLHSAEFRTRLRGVSDPQLGTQRMDQQDVILAETEVRIKTLLGLDTRQRVHTPMAFMIGKCDTWLQTLGEAPLLPAIVNGCFHVGNVKKNSNRLRALMVEVAPGLVGNAEAISSNVMYFAISPLGSSPVEFEDRDGSRKIGPDPAALHPMWVEIPTLWVLAQLMPDLIPMTED